MFFLTQTQHGREYSRIDQRFDCRLPVGHMSKLCLQAGLRQSVLLSGKTYKPVGIAQTRFASSYFTEEPWEKEIYTTAPIDKVMMGR